MTKRLISKAEFSRQANVSRMAVTKACAGALKAAVDGKSIDIDHPDAIAYIKSKRAKKTTTPTKKPPKTAAPPKKKKTKTMAALEPPEPPDEGSHFSEDDDLKGVLHLTLAEILERHGTSGQFKTFVDAKKTIVDVQTRVVKLAQLEGVLVSRDLVKVGVIEPIDAAHRKLLTDGAKTIARRVTAMTNGGRPLEDCEAFVKDQIASFIRPMKAKVKRSLKNA
jgi:hypothetical protein